MKINFNIKKSGINEAFQINKDDSSFNVLLKLIQHFADSKDVQSLQKMRDFFKQEKTTDENAQYLLQTIEQQLKTTNTF